MNRACILLVEDEADDVLLVRRVFLAAGVDAELQSVASGEEALAYMKGEGPYGDRESHPLPSLVLLDLVLPGIHGFDVLGWIRGRPEFEPVAVVVFTSSKDLRNVETAYRLGANSFLMKPLELENHAGLLNALKAYGRFEVDDTPKPGVSKTHAAGWRKAA